MLSRISNVDNRWSQALGEREEGMVLCDTDGTLDITLLLLSPLKGIHSLLPYLYLVSNGLLPYPCHLLCTERIILIPHETPDRWMFSDEHKVSPEFRK